jgi:hypothetical protein
MPLQDGKPLVLNVVHQAELLIVNDPTRNKVGWLVCSAFLCKQQNSAHASVKACGHVRVCTFALLSFGGSAAVFAQPALPLPPIVPPAHTHC